MPHITVRHWHHQQRTLTRAEHRRALGVVGIMGQQVVAIVQWVSGPPESLQVLISGARPIDRSRDRVPPPVDGFQPVQQVIHLPGANADRANLSVPNVTAAQLAAAGFVEPVLYDGTHTGETIEFALLGGSSHVATIGQYFSIDGSEDDDNIRALVDPPCPPAYHPYETAETVHSAATAAARRNSRARRSPARAASDAAAARAAAASAAAAAAAGAAPPVAADALPRPVPPAAQLGLADALMGDFAAEHAVAPNAGGAAAPRARQLHWADAHGADAAAAAAVPAAPAMPPAAPVAPSGPPAAPAGGAAEAAQGIPVGSAAPVPWRAPGGPTTPYMDQLFNRMSPAELADLSRLDDLVKMLAPGAAPPEVYIPAGDPMPRFEYIEERLGVVCSTGPIPPRTLSGWPGVYSAVRVLLRAARAALPPAVHGAAAAGSSSSAAIDLGSSYGTMAARHQLAQGTATAASSQSAMPAPQAQALINAALAVDREGAAPLSAPRPLLTAASSANSIVATRDDLASVQNLGRAMSTLPAELQLLESAEGQGFSPVTSAHMTAVSKSLASVSTTFFDLAAPLLLRSIGAHVPLSEMEERLEGLVSCLKDLFRGRCHKITQKRLSGSGFNSLLGCLRSPPGKILIPGTVDSQAALRQAREVLEWANAAVALFEPEPSTGRRFFAAARDTISQYIAVDRIDHDLVADWLELRIVAFHNSFKYFYSGQLLTRPRYDDAHITSADAREQLSQLQISNIHQVHRLQQQQQMHAMQHVHQGVLPPGIQFDETGAILPPERAPRRRRSGKKKKEAPPPPPPAAAAAPAAASSSAPATAPNPAVLYPPGTAFNNNVIGGQPHVGAATPAEMGEFTAGNADPHGKGRCFNFWRRGLCRRGAACPFSHL